MGISRAMSSPSILMRPMVKAPTTSVVVPGSKSYTNRAMICAALSEGKSRLRGALFSDDTRYMAASLRALGMEVTTDEVAKTIEVQGCAGQIAAQNAELFVGNAGTAARFLTALLCLGEGSYLIDGIERMRERPMAPLLHALRQLGADIVEEGNAGCLPVRISSKIAPESRPERVSIPGDASSQFLSGLLLSAPALPKGLKVDVEGFLVSKPYLDMTASVMKQFGVVLENQDYSLFTVPSASKYRATDYLVEPDASAASYFFAAAAITGGTITVEGLGSESAQGDLDFVKILEQMGAEVTMEAYRTTVRGTGVLHGVEVDMVNLSDTAQTLAAVATFADSPTRITGIGFIRKKETDRVGNVVKELKAAGITAIEEEDGMIIHPGTPKPHAFETYEDHRMAMSFALLGLKHEGIEILDPACTSKTFPNYFEVLESLRAD